MAGFHKWSRWYVLGTVSQSTVAYTHSAILVTLFLHGYKAASVGQVRLTSPAESCILCSLYTLTIPLRIGGCHSLIQGYLVSFMAEPEFGHESPLYIPTSKGILHNKVEKPSAIFHSSVSSNCGPEPTRSVRNQFRVGLYSFQCAFYR